jgi:hypothetical protein
MNIAHYLTGVVLLVLLVGASAATALAIRRTMLPTWSGSPAIVAEAVVGLAVMIIVAELLGSVGAFRRLPLVACSVVAALLLPAGRRIVGARTVVPPRERRLLPLRGGLGPRVIATVAVTAALSRCIQSSLDALHGGMRSFDTLWYHMPFAARFVQEGSLSHLQYVGNAPSTFYPANSELVHAVGILLFRSDVLSPMVNVGWLGLALLAGWAIGRPSGVAPVTMTSTAVVAFLPVMGGAQAGTASNDIVALALLVAAVALLVNARGSRDAVLLAAIAAGLAAGTKLNFWAPAVALGAVVIATAEGGRRLGACSRWLIGVTLGCGFWYLRNWIAVGNPFPWFGGVTGSILAVPSTTAPVDCGRTSVAHYLTDPGFILRHLVPQLRSAMGPAWWLVLGLGTLGIVSGLLSKGKPMERGLAVVALVSGAAYLFTPATAGGGEARCFAFNTRFAVPALALGMILLPLILSRRRRFGALIAVLAIAATLVVSAHPSRDPSALLVAVVLAVGSWAAGLGILHGLRRSMWVVGCVATIVLVVAAGWHELQVYERNRYTTSSLAQPVEAIAAVVRHARDARIAVTGFAESYPFYGADLANRVDYPARRDGARFASYSTCRSWLRALSRGHYDYVVTARESTHEAIAAAWTRRYPGARELLESARGTERQGQPWRWQLFQLERDRQVNASRVCSDARKPTYRRGR